MLIRSFIKLLSSFNTIRMQPELFIPAYLKNTYQFSLNTKIANIQDNKVLFEDTIFHPQGGGQPKDKGWVSFNGKKREILNSIPNKDNGEVSLEFNSDLVLTGLFGRRRSWQ